MGHGHHGIHGITLVALSSNPMWRQRAEELLTMEKHDTLPLERGDRIWLYTGASDGQPSGPGHKAPLSGPSAYRNLMMQLKCIMLFFG